ncbi:MAG: DUF1934 domain-containing protein [Lachnospiraceae bacterium]|jgi:uncharacterized beta-barrel protein YwiB (DUF1934 family)|nr:DUF1934 domain-containing protein [Lachnospiraceae bacterium]
MNKDVLISIKGLHFDANDSSDNIEVIQAGQYYKRGGMHYLVYDEPLEGSDQVSRNMIKFNDSSVSVTKKGPFTATMLFEEASKNLTNYTTPFGSIVIGLDTHNIELSDSEDSLKLNVDYSLDINYEYMADCNISIEARSAENTEF